MNNIGGGAKIHLMSYKGVNSVDGKKMLSISRTGKSISSCGKRKAGIIDNAQQFSDALNKYPEHACKKCTSRFNELMKQARA